MRHIALLAAAALVGVTAVACTDDGYYNGRPQYVTYGNTYYADTPRWDRDGDGVPNRYDRVPSNPWVN